MFKRLMITSCALATVCGITISFPARAQDRCLLQTGSVFQSGANLSSLILPGAVGGRPVSVSIDTGVPVSLIDSTLVGTSTQSKKEIVSSYGGDVEINRVPVVEMQIAGKYFKLRNAGATYLANLKVSDLRIDVIIGRDILNDCSISLNADQNTLMIGDSPQRAPGSVKAPITFYGPMKKPAVAVRLPNTPQFLAEIDTGSQNSFLSDSNSLLALGWRPKAETTVVTLGLGGPVVEGLSFTPNLIVGGLSVPDVEVRTQLVALTPERPAVHIAVIGMALLDRFNTVIDLANGVLWLAPRSTAAPREQRSTSGVIALGQGDRLRILHIMRGSPAEEAGLTEQDQICRVDGEAIPADYENWPMRTWSRDKPGRVVHLALCDGRQIHLALKEFY